MVGSWPCPQKSEGQTSSSLRKSVNYDCKKFYSKGPGINVVKLFTAVSYKFSWQASVFVSCKPFKDSIVFDGKEGAYTSETILKCSTLW